MQYTGNLFADNGVQPTNGISTHTLAIGTGYFKIKVWDGSADHYYTTGSAIPQGEWVDLSGNWSQESPAMTIAGATDGEEFKVEFDCSSNSVKVTSLTNPTPTPTPTPTDHVIYFYDQSEAPLESVNAYVWEDDSNNNGWPGVSMEPTGKYVKIDEAYFPVWKYEFSENWTTGVIITDGNGGKLTTDTNCEFLEAGFYTNGTNVASTGLDLVDKASPSEFKAFYLIGEFNNWSQKDDRYKFETTDGKVYTYNAVDKIDGTDGWKINDGTWDLDFARNPQDPHVEYNVVYELKKNTGTDGNFEREIPAGAKITFTYNENGTSTLLITTEGGGDTPVNKPTTLYIQMKYDYATQAADAPKTETEPITNPVRCHIYNSVTKEAKYEFGSDAEKMTRESFRYSLWKYDITEEDVEKYDAVDFYIYTTKDNGTYANPIEYHSNIAVYTQDGRDYEADVMWYDKENWTQFIYATATLAKHSPNDANPSRYACQSMLSYEDFNALNERDAANGGRSALYLVGWGVKFDAEDAEGNLIEEGKSLPGTPAESYPLPADNGCFYLPVHKPGSGDAGKFKVSFVNVGSASEHMSRFGAKAKALADSYDENSLGCPRHWATFDLGLVGVDTRFDYTKFDGAWQPTYASGEAGSPGSVNMVVNRSVKYNNVNQGDWLIPTDTPKGLNYFVFDSHNKCMSVSLIDFDPNPSIVANSCDVQTAQLSSDEAINLHDLGLRLDGSAVNGQVYVQNVNYVHGNVTIKAADGNNLSDDGRYSSSYSLLLDGRELGSSTGAVAGTYDIEFLPVSADCNIQIRGTYTNNRNKLTFHSRTSKASLSTEVVLAAPAAVDCDGQYVVNKNIEADGDVYTYGVFVKDGLAFRMDGDTDRYYYADLAVEGAEIIDSKHYIASYDLSPGMDGWVKNLGAEGSDWFENGEDNDWSSIMKSGVNVPVYLPAVATAADVKTLEAQTIEGEIKAVYPFIIDPEAKLTPAASQAPNRAVSNGIAGEISTAGKVMSYVPVSAPVTINVTNDNVISGVADVAADKTAEGDTEYYTISGVRVIGAPAPGIYIRRQGDSVSKVVVR
ncbi:MAG: hypothetical protein K1V88_01315 [Muribaculaceae bacterium]